MSLIGDLKKPFNIITLIISLISIFIAIYFYSKSIKKTSLSYNISYKSLVFDSSLPAAKIKVIDKNNNEINKNIYIVTISFWNSGDLPIEPSNIRQPLSIKLKDCEKILDYKLIESKYTKISNFNILLDTLNSDTSNQVLNVVWDHLDPKYGLRIQILYIGSHTTEFNIFGNILGIHKFKESSFPSGQYNIIFGMISGAIVFLLSIVPYKLLIRKFPDKPLLPVIVHLAILLILLAITFLIAKQILNPTQIYF